jgi:hypothetical protein
VAGVLIRLKLATLRHSWRAGDTSMLWLGASVGLAIAAWTWYEAVSEEDTVPALELMAVTFAVWGIIWLALPIMGGSGGDPLRPESFRLLPLPPRRLAIGLLGASAVGVLRLVALAFGRVPGREPVRPSAPDVEEPEALAHTPGLGQAPGLHRYGGGSTPCRVARVAGRRVRDRMTYHRAQAVRADEQIASLLAAIDGDGDDCVGTLLNRRDLDSEAHFPG